MQSVCSFIIFTLGFQDHGFGVGDLHRIRDQRFSLLEVFQRHIKLAHAPVNFGDPQRGGCVFGVRFLNSQILLQRRIRLAIVSQVLGEAAKRIQVIVIKSNGLPEGGNGVLVILLLLVGITEGRVNLGRARCIRNCLQHFSGLLIVALFVINVGQGSDCVLRTGIQPGGGLHLRLSFGKFLTEKVEPAELQVVVTAVRLNLDNGFVLLDGQFQQFLGLRSGLHVAQRTQINAAQKLSGFQIIGVAPDDVSRFLDSITDAAGLSVEFSQSGIQIFRGRIILDGQAIFFDGLGGILGAAIHGHHLLIHVRQRIVIVGCRPVNLPGRRWLL